MKNVVETKLYETSDISYKPVFVLLDIDRSQPIKKCFCAECKKISDLNVHNVDYLVKDLSTRSALSNLRHENIESAAKIRNALHEIECPECHNKEIVSFVMPDVTKDDSDNKKQSWNIGYNINNITVTKKTKNGITTSVENKMSISNTTIDSDYNVNEKQNFVTEVMDLENHNHRIFSPSGDKSSVSNVIDCYKYRSHRSQGNGFLKSNMCTDQLDRQLSNITKKDLFSHIMAFGGYFGHDNILTETNSYETKHYNANTQTFLKPAVNSPIANKLNPITLSLDTKFKTKESTPKDKEAIFAIINKINTIKRNEAIKHMAEPGVMSDSISRNNIDIYTDFMKNKLCLAEHKIKSDETNTALSDDRIIRHVNLITYYPAAFEFACKMADAEIENFAFNKLKKEKGDSFKQMSNAEINAEIDRLLKPVEMQKTHEDKNGTQHTETVIDSPVPSSVKAAIFRDKIEQIELQLAVVDDNILDTIKKSKNMDEMMSYLRFYVGGVQNEATIKMLGGETKMPPHIAANITRNNKNNEGLSLENLETMSKSIIMTKNIKSKFNDNPIGIANSILQYIKIAPLDKNASKGEIDTCTKAVQQILEYADKGSKSKNWPLKTQSKITCGDIETICRDSKYSMMNATKSLTVANTIVPIRNAAFLSFLKNYNNSRSIMSTINQLYDPDEHINMQMLNDTISLYSDFTEKSDSKLLTDKASIEQDINTTNKNRLKNYLESGNKLQTAYVDFIFINGDDMDNPKTEKATHGVKSYIDKLAKMIIQDSDNNKIANFYKENGVDAIVEKIKSGDDEQFAKYGKYLKTLDYYKTIMDEHAQSDKNFDLALSEIINKQVEEHRQQMIKESEEVAMGGRDGKAIFENRSISQIHDELSVMASQKIVEKKTIKYNENEMKLEGVYQCPGDDDENHKWRFKLMKDTFDFIRTAKDLYNCIGGSNYTTAGVNKTRTYLYMENELGEKVAAVELNPDGRDPETKERLYSCLQFQGPHDKAVSARYAPIAKQWLDDHKINYKKCRDVALFGQDVAIYGNGNADFHTDELDEATGKVVTKEQNVTIIKNRKKQAAKVYGEDENGDINIPPVPDDIKDFNFSNIEMLDL